MVVERASTAQDLGPKFNRTAADVVRFLMGMGEMVTATQSLTDDQIELFAAELGVELRLVDPGEEQEVELQKRLLAARRRGEDETAWITRPPVITIMGHVDHGKTKLLDQIRNANVVAGEAGGITQHIGAYQVEKDGRAVTFIDTPGHEAFTAMRARGAEATDIVVLVVAADDGVMPQTIEALNHAKAAEVPIVVAINKIDREEANPDRVMQQLSEQGLIPQQWGGDTEFVQVSALQNVGIDDLLETLLLVADVEDLRATPDGRAQGVVLESHLDIGRGPVATILVQRGTLRVGDPLVAGPAWGRVRAILDDQGNQLKEAGPVDAGRGARSRRRRRRRRPVRRRPRREDRPRGRQHREHWHRSPPRGATPRCPPPVPASRTSSTRSRPARPPRSTSSSRPTSPVRSRPSPRASASSSATTSSWRSCTAPSAASRSTTCSWRRRPTPRSSASTSDPTARAGSWPRPKASRSASTRSSTRSSRTSRTPWSACSPPSSRRSSPARPRSGRSSRCRGSARSPAATCATASSPAGSKVRFLREGTIIWKGAISSLRRFKDDAQEVRSGFECGIGLTDFQDLKQGDVIETYEEREVPRPLAGGP